MNKSESIKELAAALIKFNSKVTAISKDAKNPQFRSEYVTLDKLIEITRPILQEVGLSVMQFPLSDENGRIGIQSLLIHESGEYIESNPLFMKTYKMIRGGEYVEDFSPQVGGSYISYLRRYGYQAILCLNTGEDDDGNKATFGVNNNTQQRPQQQRPQSQPQNNAPSGNGNTNNVSITLEEAANTIMPAGKFAGKTLGEILPENKGYISFVANTSKDAKLKAAAIKLLEG